MLKNIPTKSVVTILAIGVLVGFAIVGSFNAFVDYTSSNKFCGATCHEMDTVTKEYMESPFHKNNHGVRVGCADCHVPKPLFARLWRKAKATKELYHKVMGTIDTPEKFEAKRLILARSEWQRLRESDSRECRNCHFYEAMTIETQPNDARFWHPVAMDEGYTCVDCHKGFVHRLPDLAGEIQKAAEHFEAVLAADALSEDRLYITRATVLYSGVSTEDGTIAELEPGTPLTVLERQDGWFKVRIQGRQYQADNHTLYDTGDRTVVLARARGGSMEIGENVTRNDATGLDWRPARMEGWVSRKNVTGQIASLWDYGKAIYQNECVRCHVLFSPSAFWATEWKNKLHNMRRKVGLSAEQMEILLKYLQYHAKPQGMI
uniref:Cytochrome c-type protein n=1 Tax=Candidatus Kentrum sp. FW TaxID=2126338 RepID=A0A450T7E9_9GAMM|nr:MAG: trimethylamine-N-oxide reductase (cytochrome c), cytochrome c-type subunit TorC [Candidatus Kentron sp. FW]